MYIYIQIVSRALDCIHFTKCPLSTTKCTLSKNKKTYTHIRIYTYRLYRGHETVSSPQNAFFTICMYIYIYVCVCFSATKCTLSARNCTVYHLYVHLHIYVYIYIYMYTCTYICIRVLALQNAHCLPQSVYSAFCKRYAGHCVALKICIYTYSHMYIYAHICMYVNTCIYFFPWKR